MEGFQNIDVVDSCGCESPEKSIPLFILYLFLCLFQILAVDQSINTFTRWSSCGGPGKSQSTPCHSKSSDVFTNCPSWREHSPGGPGGMPDRSREGIIYTLPCKLPQISLMPRKAQHLSLHELPAEWQIHTYSTKCHNYMGWTRICLVQFKKNGGGGTILIFSLPVFSVHSLCVYHKLDLLRVWCWATHMANTQLRDVKGKSLFCFWIISSPFI